MQLIVSQYDAQKTYDVEWIEVNTSVGNRIIQEGHAPLIVMLKSNSTLTFLDMRDGEQTIPVSGGMLSVASSHVLLLLTE